MPTGQPEDGGPFDEAGSGTSGSVIPWVGVVLLGRGGGDPSGVVVLLAGRERALARYIRFRKMLRSISICTALPLTIKLHAITSSLSACNPSTLEVRRGGILNPASVTRVAPVGTGKDHNRKILANSLEYACEYAAPFGSVRTKLAK